MSGDGAAEATTPALALSGITRRFGNVVALHDVSLTLRPGTVHALLGENGAGKTTLMRIAYGMMRPDAGAIEIDGTRRHLASPADAIAAGVGMVHQHFTLVPAMTVAENLALGGHGRYSARAARDRVAKVAERTGFALDPDAAVGSLTVGAQQRVEIAKALARDARVLVLDEPTGVLAPSEIDDLLRWLREYVARGNAAVLITHKLREALAVADDVTVLRRGARVFHGAASGASEESLTAAMIGGSLVQQVVAPMERVTRGAPVLRAEGMSVAGADGVVRVREASFEIAGGELVGIAGVEGSGQRELLRALAGRLPLRAGTLDRPADVGFVPEDRHHDAVLLNRGLAENIALRGVGRARGRIDWRAVRARTAALIEAYDVRADRVDQPMRALSGGNQQKLVLARELVRLDTRTAGDGDTQSSAARGDETSAIGASPSPSTTSMLAPPDFVPPESASPDVAQTASARGGPPERKYGAADASMRHHSTAHRIAEPRTAIVVENPTRGLDVRATAAVHERLREAARGGAAVVVYSSDLDEVLALASRVLVVFNGTVRALPADRDAIARAMLGIH